LSTGSAQEAAIANTQIAATFDLFNRSTSATKVMRHPLWAASFALALLVATNKKCTPCTAFATN